MPSDMPRLYVDKDLNATINEAHWDVMKHCGYKISKADFLRIAFNLGIANKEALYEAFPRRVAV